MHEHPGTLVHIRKFTINTVLGGGLGVRNSQVGSQNGLPPLNARNTKKNIVASEASDSIFILIHFLHERANRI